MKNEQEYKSAINCVNTSKLEMLVVDLTQNDTKIVVLDGTNITNKETLLAEIQKKIITRSELLNWAQLSDLLGITISREVGKKEFALVWTDVNVILESGLSDLITASDIFLQTARELTRQGHRFRVFLVGTGGSFQ